MKRVILVTGASAGIGRMIALLLKNAGYTVYGTSRHAGSLEDGTLLLPMDVTDSNSIDQTINTILERESRIDVLVNNAGMGIAGAVEDMTVDECKHQFDVNFFGCHSIIRRILPEMIKRGQGHIINISSMAGLIPIPFQSAYSASKAALDSMSVALRAEVKAYGVKVTVIQPGDTRTSFTKSRLICKASREESRYREVFSRSISVMARDEQKGHFPDKVARLVLYALERNRPPRILRVGVKYKMLAFLKRVLPASLYEAGVSSIYVPKGKK